MNSRFGNSSMFQLYWLRLVLLAFIATRAVTPMGFMPNGLDSAIPFVLCPANAHSAALLAVSGDHHGHQHHDHPTNHFADSECPFSAAGISVGIYSFGPDTELLVPASGDHRGREDDLKILNTYHLPPVRAPPARRFSS